MNVLGVVIVVALTCVNLLLFKVVRSFGVYADQLREYNRVIVEVHRTNLMLAEQNEDMIRRIEILREGESAA